MAIILSLLLLGGCKVVLHKDLNNEDANSMISILLRQDISAEKVYTKKEGIILKVESSEQALAIDLLNLYGYPRRSFKETDEIFKKTSMISSPLEERVRYIYTISQELSNTLTQIDGVINARVHVNIPEREAYIEKPKPASAGVFIKHKSSIDLSNQIPKIKSMVAKSIENLTMENVSVSFFSSDLQNEEMVNIKLHTQRKQDEQTKKIIGIVLLSMTIILITTIAIFKKSIAELISKLVTTGRRKSNFDNKNLTPDMK